MPNRTVQFWLAWTLVTILGYGVGVLLLLPVAVSLARAAQWPLLIGLLSGAVLGATVGTAQWLLLRRRTPISVGWVGATVLGGMFGMALGMSVEPVAPIAATAPVREAATLVIPWQVAWQTALAGALFGVGLGLAQWRVLRLYARSAGWWIIVNGAAWAVGLGLGALLAPLISTLGALVVTGLLAAAITAYHMERWQWQLRKRTGPIPGRY
jgi:uncharacterized integral membrane protein